MKFATTAFLLVAGSANVSAGSINDIEHVIFFMQENRAFDHYFGTLSGVRGFNDRTTVPMQSGFDAFHQPTDQDNLEKYMLPFPAESNQTAAMCMGAPEMFYPTDIKIVNKGRMDSWNTARDPGVGMSYFNRDDLPFYYALYDNFAVGDQYFQSTFTCTCPNRLHFFTGSNGLSVGQPASMENAEPNPGWDWVTTAELLEAKGVSWKVYQEEDNFDDNGFAWHDTFLKAKSGEPLFDKGMARQPDAILALESDVKADTLPQVSWVVAPAIKSEHAAYHPSAGEDWTARLLIALQANAQVYAKTAFVLNYDEGGQFYDHAWTPTPPMSEKEGVTTMSTEGEVNFDATYQNETAPIGLGFRVPMAVISPWSRGNIVVSEVFDHVSAIKFLEQRFSISNPNLSPWRRAMVGDLTSAFDFASPPDFSWPSLPDTSGYVEAGDVECDTLPDTVVPTQQTTPVQEAGTRISRAVDYVFDVSDEGVATDGTFSFTIDVTGALGAPFVLFDLLHLDTKNPRNYAVEGGKSITDKVAVVSGDDKYSFILMGPNGFVRQFDGLTAENANRITTTYNKDEEKLGFEIAGGDAAQFTITDNAYKLFEDSQFADNKFEVVTKPSGNWYDVTIAAKDGSLSRRFMGRMETGKDTVSDPAMAAGVEGLWKKAESHHDLAAKFTTIKRVEGKMARTDKDARFIGSNGEL